VEPLRQAEDAVEANKELPSPFKDEPFIKEWLRLEPSLGETDLRPLLHLSRDTATRDFGADDLTTQGRELRDALIKAKSGNQLLTKVIQDAGAIQAEKAMARAWQLKAGKRSWRNNEDMVPLVEPCKVFRELGPKAASLLAQAPVAQLGPGPIPTLYEQDWARPVLDQWAQASDVNRAVKQAIESKKKARR